MSFTRREDLPMHQWLIDHIQDAVMFIGVSGEIINGSKMAYELLGVSTSHATVQDTILDMDHIKISARMSTSFSVNTKDDARVEVKTSYVNEYNMYLVLLIPSSLHQQTATMKHHLNQMYTLSQEGLVLYDEHRILDCDQSFARIFGYTIEEMKQLSFYDLWMEKHASDRSFSIYPNTAIQMMGKRKDGVPIHIELLVQHYPVQDQVIQTAFVRDITDVVKSEQRMEFISYYDELTDLPNQHYFSRILADSIAYAENHKEKVAVFFIDIDYFKQINDTLGYKFGDKFLKAFGDRLRSLLDSSMFLARMNGDEFILLLRHFQSKQVAKNFAEKLIKAFEPSIVLDDHEIFTSISVGISFYPDHGKAPNDLIKYADSAMYVSKDKQRNHYREFDPSISARFKQALTMETELRRALSESQFELHYQPQKEVDSNRIVGMEALLRWKHPKSGYIPPSRFIPLAEKSGFIIELGDWVLREACKQNKRWQEQGFAPVVVGVNLSVKQFHQKNLVGRVAQILEETGLDPKYLELEITETIAMAHEESILDTLKGLREIGVRVSIDDFGTGYSSLKYLSVFPVTKLKIDRIFLNSEQKQNLAIVKSIIHMSHSLQMKVIAEGVETEEQLNFLKQERCDEIQGYFFSKPLPLEKVTHLLCEYQ
ncbi:EAL domain-containing protein [Radiobacillus kanasensis]|uniref:EAL domain-containing protein n=1 Tax=Radiobacillus kanasensis TaxID=2844358 RepID=UPI001E480546|nr:EAL domain-containing protein [Radiobacillus kanasensis]UFU00857.1 EAL domain-containing protein [Radiobacillus kanasensis]